MSLTNIQTTTGILSPEKLGRTLIRKHILVGFPGGELDADAPKCKHAEGMARGVDRRHELQALGSSLGGTLSHRPGQTAAFRAGLSQKSSTNIVCTTGACFETKGNGFTFRYLSTEQVTEIYVNEMSETIRATGDRRARHGSGNG